jgi:hypothetical protein
MTIDVMSDAEGLRQALSELLEQGFARSRVTRSLDDSDENGRERIFGSLPALTLSPGYYKQAESLLWLEKAKKTGLTGEPFTMAEADGLVAVAEARAEFERNHPPCGICGALQDSAFSTSCHKCGTEFMRRSA